MTDPSAHHPALTAALRARTPLLWTNPSYDPDTCTIAPELDPIQARTRLDRCAGLMADVFDELHDTQGHLASPLTAVPKLRQALGSTNGLNLAGVTNIRESKAQALGTWLLKRDDALPVAGSIKARGGFHEVLALAERLAQQAGLLDPKDDRRVLRSPQARTLFASHTVAVGSTGNLGLSIGLIAAALGFRTVVHMSLDAKEWKKERLRKAGIEVVEHTGDYAQAVAAGRALAANDPLAYFVDDEHSSHLFLGYAAAADELAAQLHEQQRKVDASHPLFVYLPCGVGGAPGGIAYGLKQRFGAHVHCFFAEPIASPCMLAQLAYGDGGEVSVYDLGLDNRTEADGLAVGQASPLVAPLMVPRLAGVYTVADESLFNGVHLLYETEGIPIEPSAAAALMGPAQLLGSETGRAFLNKYDLIQCMADATHVLWSTGGSLVPAEEWEGFRRRGRSIQNDR